MSGPANTVLYDVMKSVLTRAEAALAGDLPARRFVHIGAVPWDCGDILAVGAGNLESHDRADTQLSGVSRSVAVVPSINFDVVLLRCVATIGAKGQIPTDTVLDLEGKGLLTDLWKLWYGLVTDWQAGQLITGADCNLIYFGSASPLGPSGGLAGWKIPIRYKTPQ